MAQPSLGHKRPGTVGLDAGRQPGPGLYVGNRFAYFDATTLRDRDGERIAPPGFDVDAFFNAFGVAGVLRLNNGLYLVSAIALPLAALSIEGGEPRATVDRMGLGDIFVQPIGLGWRWDRFDLVGSYAFYAPTRQFSRSGLAAPQWSHQFSVGGTFYFGDDNRGRVSALSSYDLYQQKIGIDVTRGDSIQIQFGIGGSVFDRLDVGLAGYGLWQVRDDEGSALPELLAGRREQVYGLGPEVGVPLPKLGAKLGLRYVRDFAVRGRPEGQLVVVDLSLRLWEPSA